jgi:transcriptional regulator with XRE-family HTH domain
MAKEKRPEAYSDIQADIGRRIKWARELVEPNRAEFARTLGVDRSTLQKIEDGSRAPSIFNVIELSHQLRVSPDYILTGDLRGVDGEVAGHLVRHHPELMDRPGRTIASKPVAPNSSKVPRRTGRSAKAPGTDRLPRKPKPT